VALLAGLDLQKDAGIVLLQRVVHRLETLHLVGMNLEEVMIIVEVIPISKVDDNLTAHPDHNKNHL